MKTDIKRLAQFLFDNAEMIAKELEKSSHYRVLNVQVDAFKRDAEVMQKVTLSIYDETTTHYYLYDNSIVRRRLRRLFQQMNREAGLVPPPKPVKVREKL
jgi:hypothetical protein